MNALLPPVPPCLGLRSFNSPHCPCLMGSWRCQVRVPLDLLGYLDFLELMRHKESSTGPIVYTVRCNFAVTSLDLKSKKDKKQPFITSRRHLVEHDKMLRSIRMVFCIVEGLRVPRDRFLAYLQDPSSIIPKHCKPRTTCFF